MTVGNHLREERSASATSSIARWMTSPTAMSVLVAVLGLVRVISLYRASDSVLITAIPDDAFYYLQTALNRVELGRWTFDGVAPATGFHLLHGYGLACLHALVPALDWRGTFLIVSLVGVVELAISVYLMSRLCARWFGHATAVVAALPFLTITALSLPTMVLESGLVVLLTATAIYVAASAPSRVWGPAGLLAIGLLGSLARTDFVVLTTALMLGGWVIARQSRSGDFVRLISLWAGSLVGLGVVGVHGLLVSGVLGQGSVQMKLHWARTGGVPYDSPFAWACVAMAACSALLMIEWRRPDVGAQGLRALPVTVRSGVLGSCLAVTGYLLTWAVNWQAIQPWYLASALAPLSVVLSAFAVAFVNRWVPVVGILLACALVVGGLASGALFRGQWVNQVGTLEAARQIGGLPDGWTVGAWNAGILGYFSQRGVVNLDGLANDDVHAFITSGRLDTYLAERGIDHLVDVESMLSAPRARVRGGYSGAWVETCVLPVRYLHPGVDDGAGAFLLYAVDRECLASVGGQ